MDVQNYNSIFFVIAEGALRVDANVSVHKDNEPFGVRTEVKNIGSIRGVSGAIQYEIQRQMKLLNKGQSIVNETRAWDANTKTTLPMRDKEQQQVYEIYMYILLKLKINWLEF